MADTVAALPETVLALKEEMERVEEDGSLVVGIHLPAEMAKAIHFELSQMYGANHGNDLILLFGAEVISQDADQLKLITSDQV